MAVNARVWTGSLYGRIPAPSEWDGIQPEYQPNIRELCNEVIARALDACHLMRQIKRNAPRTEQLAAVRDAIPTLFPDRTSVDSVQRNNFTLALLDCVIALVEFGHYSTFDPRSASFGPDFAAIQQVLIPFLFVPQPCRKMAWPAMPIACAGRDLSSNMPVLVAQLVPSLLKTLDGRGDVCAPFGNFSAEEARFQVSLSADLKGRSFNSHPCSPDPDTHAFELRLQLAGIHEVLGGHASAFGPGQPREGQSFAPVSGCDRGSALYRIGREARQTKLPDWLEAKIQGGAAWQHRPRDDRGHGQRPAALDNSTALDRGRAGRLGPGHFQHRVAGRSFLPKPYPENVR
eukprot:2327091-Rhodomonas_salina.1